jgi:hypothetical protein
MSREYRFVGCVLQIFSKKRNSQICWKLGSKRNNLGLTNPKKNTSKYFLTRNIQVLIYGAWEGQSENCKSFFTASYYEIEKQDLVVRYRI